MTDLVLTSPQSRYTRQYRNPLTMFLLFIGGYGSGKSETLVATAMGDIFSYAGANVGVYSPTYDLLKLILLPRFESYLDGMRIPYRLNKSDYIIDIEGYGDIIFRSLDKQNRIIGYEHFSAHVDEIDTLPLVKAESAWQKIIGRNRQALPKYPDVANKIGLYTTPEGYNFTFKYFAETGEAYRKMSPEAKAMYKYVRAPTYSNKHLPKGYIETLRATYPAHLVEAYIEGFWVNLNSGAVYPAFHKELNHCDTMERGSEDILIGMDFNVQRGCSVAHVIRTGPSGEEEVHAIFEVFNAYDTPKQVELIKERFDIKKHNIIVYPDAAGKQRKSSNASQSDFQVLRDAGFHVKEYNYNGSVKDRVMAFNAMICDAQGRRRYKVNTAQCPQLTLGLETQVYDEHGQPEKGPGKWDDINDAPGYLMVRKYPIIKPKATTVFVRGTH